MGVSAGGATKHMDQAFITAPAYPPEILLTGIIVNKLGKRFVAEDSYHSRTSAFVMEQPDSPAYPDRRRGHLQNARGAADPLIDGWETVEEMEAALGIPEGNLVATLDRYNEYAAKGEDPDFHKQPEYVRHKTKDRGRAFDLSLGKAMYSAFTLGGLAMSIDGEVLREDGSVVPGLYAAGRVRVELSPGRQGLFQRHAIGRGIVLRSARRSARSRAREQRESLSALDGYGLAADGTQAPLAAAEQLQAFVVVLLEVCCDG